MSGKLHLAILAGALAIGAGGIDKVAEEIGNNAHLLYAAAEYKVFVGDAEAALRLLHQAEARCNAPRPVQSAPPETHARTLCPNAPKG